MSPKRIVDFQDELNQENKCINETIAKTKQLKSDTKASSIKLQELREDLESLSAELGEEGPARNELDRISTSPELDWDDLYFLECNPLLRESRICKEIYKKPSLLPELSGVDYAVTAIASAIAAVVDFLLVRIPKDTNYLSTYPQKGSDLTGWMRGLGVSDSGKLKPFFQWMEKTCKVPYDKVTGTGISGFGSWTHRMLTPGHDPILGLVFGTIDIFHGQMTVVDTSGALRILKTYQPKLLGKVFAPFLFLGHLVSDICTSMGLPIPGWGFTQLLQFGKFGPKQNHSIADLSRYMYMSGYDLRHMVTMAVSTAVIEIVIRAYHYLSSVQPMENRVDMISSSISSQELSGITNKLKLHKMLFLAHTAVAGGNAVKVFAYHGNPTAINLPQWIAFLKESVTIVKALLRDTTPEKIIRNRNVINDTWEDITAISLTGLRTDLTVTTAYGKLVQ